MVEPVFNDIIPRTRAQRVGLHTLSSYEFSLNALLAHSTLNKAPRAIDSADRKELTELLTLFCLLISVGCNEGQGAD